MRKTVPILAAGLVGFFGFYGWVSLVGPQIHVVESVIGLVIAIGLGSVTWWHSRKLIIKMTGIR